MPSWSYQPRLRKGQHGSWRPLKLIGFLVVLALLVGLVVFAVNASFRDRVSQVKAHIDECGLDFTSCSTTTAPSTTTTTG